MCHWDFCYLFIVIIMLSSNIYFLDHSIIDIKLRWKYYLKMFNNKCKDDFSSEFTALMKDKIFGNAPWKKDWTAYSRVVCVLYMLWLLFRNFIITGVPFHFFNKIFRIHLRKQGQIFLHLDLFYVWTRAEAKYCLQLN